MRATHNGNRQEYDRDLKAVHMVLDRAGDPHLSAVQRRAKEILAELDAGEQRLQQASSAAYGALDDPSAAASILAWSGDVRSPKMFDV